MSNEHSSLQDKVVLITGGALGAVTAELLSKNGAKIAYVYHANVKAAEDAIRKLTGQGHEGYQADLRTEASIKDVFEKVKKDFGKIDIAINNVGKVIKKPIVNISEEEYEEMFNLNSKVAFFFIKYAAIHVTNGGKIVTTVTSLLAAFTGNYSVYAGSKAPVEHFTRAASKELQQRRISVNAIAPGPMDTPFFYPQEEDAAVAFHKSQALDGRLTDIHDIAPIIKHLVSDGNWITGQTIFANGGYTTR
ncbi:putative short-chain dehydrogenase [Meira miltonrushii]|uniref:Putative short-chain dehydrogenase n=1 Tax=Meira miltonrushii TaxID=1280837 RepID=A0A316VQM3_9BASI|nr:putative short-chain dehydrogenase [Meira miltonrushii]PWN38461.1 putative short-chain dehydrogenase [Meira miltonrushii]